MTDAEIIKALECRASEKDVLCVGCPYEKYYLLDCQRQSARDALDLINRQKTEIERLQSKVNHLKRYDEQRDIALHSRLIATAKAEAIKEFAERLKVHSRKMQSSDFSGEFWDRAVLASDIDTIAGEMAGNMK